MTTPYDKRKHNALVEAYRSGKRVTEIAYEHGVSTSTVYRWVNRAGALEDRRYKVDEHDVELAKSLYEEGMTVSIIAKKLELKYSTVRDIVKGIRK